MKGLEGRFADNLVEQIFQDWENDATCDTFSMHYEHKRIAGILSRQR